LLPNPYFFHHFLFVFPSFSSHYFLSSLSFIICRSSTFLLLISPPKNVLLKINETFGPCTGTMGWDPRGSLACHWSCPIRSGICGLFQLCLDQARKNRTALCWSPVSGHLRQQAGGGGHTLSFGGRIWDHRGCVHTYLLAWNPMSGCWEREEGQG
jgi:hypothetical protein